MPHSWKSQRHSGYQYPDNVRAVLATLSDKGSILQAEIANRTGLRLSIVSQITATLLSQKLILADVEDLQEASPWEVRFRLNPRGAYSVGLTVDKAQIKLALLDLERQQIHSVSCLSVGKTVDDVIEFIVTELEVASTEKGLALARLEGICIACDDLDVQKIVSLHASPLSSITASDLQRALSLKFRVPIFVEAPICVTVLGKAHLKRMRPKDSLFYLLLDENLSCGFFSEGQYQRAGGLGILPLVDPLTTNLSNSRRRLGEWFREARPSSSSTGDDQADAFISQAAAYLIVPLLTVMGLMYPSSVYLGGLPADITSRLCRKLNELRKQFVPEGVKLPAIEAGSIHDDASAVGAATLPFVFGLFRPVDMAGLHQQ